MKEVREKILQLATAYERQLELYKRIGEVGSQEEDLITKGDLELLLRTLREKGKILKQATEQEEHIKSLQTFLVRHFQVEQFSIPQLKSTASDRYQEDFNQIEVVLTELVPVLEGLEKQERRNEQFLSGYLDASRGTRTNEPTLKLARGAYANDKGET